MIDTKVAVIIAIMWAFGLWLFKHNLRGELIRAQYTHDLDVGDYEAKSALFGLSIIAYVAYIVVLIIIAIATKI